jgi:hypothetical protein
MDYTISFKHDEDTGDVIVTKTVNYPDKEPYIMEVRAPASNVGTPCDCGRPGCTGASTESSADAMLRWVAGTLDANFVRWIASGVQAGDLETIREDGGITIPEFASELLTDLLGRLSESRKN